jgi:uncharacterized protein with HEPN domain
MANEADRVRLRHMFDAAREAVDLLGGRSLADLRQDRVLQLALTRLVEIVGEAAGRVSPDARQLLPDLPWPDIVGMRNRLIHAYFNVDLTVLHTTIVDDLPVLIVALADVLEPESDAEAEGRNDRDDGA